jgi:type IV pilus assembly protein PilC
MKNKSWMVRVFFPFWMVRGVLVGGMVVAMYLPIFKLGSVIH